MANLTPDAAKRCLTQLKACCNWAMQEGLIDANPFAAMKIKTPKGATEEQDVNPLWGLVRGHSLATVKLAYDYLQLDINIRLAC